MLIEDIFLLEVIVQHFLVFSNFFFGALKAFFSQKKSHGSYTLFTTLYQFRQIAFCSIVDWSESVCFQEKGTFGAGFVDLLLLILDLVLQDFIRANVLVQLFFHI